ncbi:phosphatase PAP2 family protein [Paenibacillus sedimenti]|uniref:Phosphatase PAP2 family protein n=1 Tax=Paenibacillus sedimenti TaxID=2770274 RepID=A0A926KVS9_9BACL|nr:phosphatase PAP2 family protein [Paenibacillus sedimenti]MBD0383796.1 phosphatase PAP2 family protein [Paenibacillus sedimenti]
MKKESFISYLLACSALLSIPLVGLIYVYLNHGGERYYSLVTDLDRQIPFLKIFVVPYVSWYVFLLAGFMYLAYKDRQTYYKTLLQFIIGLLLCYGVYAVYQTHVPRPAIGGDDWMMRMVQWVYNNDQPFNCFPSTHVLTSYLMMKAYLSTAHISRIYTSIVTLLSLLIIASTQFMKQHVLLDIIGAVLVAEGVIYVVNRVRKGWFVKPLAAGMQRGQIEGGLER